MDEIQVEKKRRGAGWLWLLPALVIIALPVWWLWPDGAGDAEREALIARPGEPEGTETVTAATAQEAMVAAILANPDEWVGRAISAAVSVVDVPTNRGFWIEQEGEKMFVLLVDDADEERAEIDAGQELRVAGTVRDQSWLPHLPGEPLKRDTDAIIQKQRVFLVADARGIQVQ
jgi:hypothetical protein